MITEFTVLENKTRMKYDVTKAFHKTEALSVAEIQDFAMKVVCSKVERRDPFSIKQFGTSLLISGRLWASGVCVDVRVMFVGVPKKFFANDPNLNKELKISKSTMRAERWLT